jgi:hypothetical protein
VSDRDVSALCHLQRSLAETLRRPGEDLPDDVLGLVVPGGTLDAAGALDVYRRGYVARLTEQLGETYPSVWRVVGDDDFFALCRAFLADHPSCSYNLSDYGREFPGFLDAAPDLPAFLAELARFELAVHDLFHAHAHVPVDVADLSGLGDLTGVTFRFGSAVRLVACDRAVYDIYRHRNDEEPPDLDLERPQRVLLYRQGSDVLAREVEAAEFTALEALAAGSPVEEAVERAVTLDEGFGPERVAALFQVVARCGLVEGVERGVVVQAAGRGVV